MERAKGRWRQTVRKPTRRVRRFFRKTMTRKGKGKGKPRRLSGKVFLPMSWNFLMMTMRNYSSAKVEEKDEAKGKVFARLEKDLAGR